MHYWFREVQLLFFYFIFLVNVCFVLYFLFCLYIFIWHFNTECCCFYFYNFGKTIVVGLWVLSSFFVVFWSYFYLKSLFNKHLMFLICHLIIMPFYDILNRYKYECWLLLMVFCFYFIFYRFFVYFLEIFFSFNHKKIYKLIITAVF